MAPNCARGSRSTAVSRRFATSPFARQAAQWTTIGENLVPEYHVVSGVRRLPNDQGNALRSLGVKITRDVIDQNRWQAFWDAPLRVPGTPDPPAGGRAGGGAGRGAAPEPPAAGEIPLNGGRVYELPRTPEEIRRSAASFKATSCTRQHRRREHRGDVPGSLDGHLLGRSPLHDLPGRQPAADGRARVDRGEVGGLYLQRRSEGILDDDDAVGHVARHGRTRSAVSLRRPGDVRDRRVEGVEPNPDRRRPGPPRSRSSRRRTRSTFRARKTRTSATCTTERMRTRSTASASGWPRAKSRRSGRA